jgi:hypothetical protein
VAGDGGGGGHRRADQMGAAAGTLAAFEIAVGGRGAALARGEAVGVHGQAHRAARLAPLEPGGGEDLVQALGLGLLLDLAGARHHQRQLDVAGNRPAPWPRRGGAQVLDARVGAGADEDLVDRMSGLSACRRQAHVLASARAMPARFCGSLKSFGRVRHAPSMPAAPCSGEVPQVTCGSIFGGVDVDDGIEFRAGVRLQRRQ